MKNSLKVSSQIQKAYEKSLLALNNSHSPYSKFRVGAAIVVQGKSEVQIFSGTNIENASYGATVCAERVAIWKAVSEGAKKVKAVVVVTDSKIPVPPCALCLQVLAEFSTAKTEIYLGNAKSLQKKYLFEELLPFPFQADFL